jgi:hypothetical protein
MEDLSGLDEPRTFDQLADGLNTGVDEVEARVAYLQGCRPGEENR